jgi:hypothetical protein
VNPGMPSVRHRTQLDSGTISGRGEKHAPGISLGLGIGEGGFVEQSCYIDVNDRLDTLTGTSDGELLSTPAYVGAQAVEFLLYHLVTFTDARLQA